MDLTYAEFGTEVILHKNHGRVDFECHVGQKASILDVDGVWCYVLIKSTQEHRWWPIQDMILATDEPLLRK